MYYRSLRVDHTKVPSTQTDFPVLVSVIDATLKTIANGGHVENANGYDIGFFADATGTTPLKWEIERYNPATGELIAWVKIPSLSSSADTVFYLLYGDASIITDRSDPVNVWSNGFAAVYHFGDADMTYGAKDSKGGYNLTSFPSGGPQPVGGQVGGGVSLPGTTVFDAESAPVTTTPITISAWVNVAADGVIASMLDTLGSDWNGHYIQASAGSVVAASIQANFAVAGSASKTGVPTGAWANVAAVFLGTSRTAYVNGVGGTPDATVVAPTAPPSDLCIGAAHHGSTVDNAFSGLADELRVSNVARSADWLLAEYNNQSAPGAFVILGTEGMAGVIEGDGNSAGVGVASAFSGSVIVSAGSAPGVAICLALSAAITQADGNMQGIAVCLALGGAIISGVGATAGSSTANADAVTLLAALASAIGVSEAVAESFGDFIPVDAFAAGSSSAQAFYETPMWRAAEPWMGANELSWIRNTGGAKLTPK